MKSARGQIWCAAAGPRWRRCCGAPQQPPPPHRPSTLRDLAVCPITLRLPNTTPLWPPPPPLRMGEDASPAALRRQQQREEEE